MRRMLTLALAASVTVFPGCGTAAYRGSAAPNVALTDDGVVLQVRNNTGMDVEVLVIDGGTWRSLGSVSRASTARFDVARLNDAGAPLRILARLPSGHGSARAGPLSVLPGQVVTLTVEANLDRSFTTVH